MGTVPNIIMRCPKCSKEFPLDESYCESCSAMLEPSESEVAQPVDSLRAAIAEEIGDVKVEQLRTAVEGTFIYALLYEQERLKKRLADNERAVQELQAGGEDTGSHALIMAVGEKEREKDELLKRLAEIDTELEEMKEAIEAESDKLRAKLGHITDPGFLWFLNGKGRYYRKVSQELKKQGILQDILAGKRSARYFRTRRIASIYLLVVLTALFTFIVSSQWFSYIDTGRKSTIVLSKQQGRQGAVTREDIVSLLEDVKRANVSKDIVLWESRYSKDYLQLPGKKESVSDQWRHYDYRSLAYDISDVTLEGDRARAVVTWEMELFSRKANEVKKVSQRLQADFIMEEGILRIRSIVKM